jgi:biopolymer transport protein ExbB
MTELFLKGGPIMWPLLALSLVTLATVFERLLFLGFERRRRDPDAAGRVLAAVERRRLDEAIRLGRAATDLVARVLAHGLEHRDTSLSNALLQAAGRELDRYNRGLVMLDTAITLGPLLGLLGTVTGLIRAFGLLGATALSAQQRVITGGIAEALIATAFGLSIAIVALIPFNYFNSRLERVRREIEDSTNHLELLLARKES